jgi:DNA-binding response OmpR family regulator
MAQTILTLCIGAPATAIMITAYGDAETKRKALGNGAEALLTKPIDFVMLRNEIDMRVEVGRDHGLRGRGSETVALNSMSNWYRVPPSTEPPWGRRA